MAEAAATAAGPRAAEAPSSLLLVVGGECSCPGLLSYVLGELERGGAGGGGQAGWGPRAGAGRAEPGVWGRERGVGGGRIRGPAAGAARSSGRGLGSLGVRRAARCSAPTRPDPGAAWRGRGLALPPRDWATPAAAPLPARRACQGRAGSPGIPASAAGMRPSREPGPAFRSSRGSC